MPNDFENLTRDLQGHIFDEDTALPFGLVPWWPGRVAWKRDAELVLNRLALLPRRAGRIHWHIQRYAEVGDPARLPVFYIVSFRANVLEEA